MDIGRTSKRIVRNGDEEDVFTGWRKIYCWTKRPGATKKIKTIANRRDRHNAKINLRKENENE